MPELLTDEALCAKALAVLDAQLGPVQALRFLAVVSRESFAYQHWRDQHFAVLSLDEILEQSREPGQ
ncbi:MAG: hypothetical protein HC897_18590 [Thermoanaerobaculia bacterium]|nr:hypothetical protein [Thermoanaerobaculia bacterium]